MASVDVIVPCYNYAHYLSDCIESIVSQADADVRVLIVDDKSPDETNVIGPELAAANDRVTYVRNERNLGLIGSANEHIVNWAEAEYMLLLSADDMLMLGALSRAITVMQTHPEIDLVYGRSQRVGSEFGVSDITASEAELEYQIIDGRTFLHRNFTHANPVPAPTAILRTRAQKKLGGYLQQFPHTSDMEMWMRFASRGSIGVIKNLQACYRIHEASMSTSRLTRAISDRQECLETCAYVVEHWCGNIPDAQLWLKEMNRKVVREAYWLANHADHSEGQRQACAAFAKRFDPDRPISTQRLKYEINKVLHALGVKKPKADTGVFALSTSGTFGWWPE